MAQSGWRLPDDLLKRVRVHCAESGEREEARREEASGRVAEDRPPPLGEVMNLYPGERHAPASASCMGT
jgi:hypothetical protein